MLTAGLSDLIQTLSVAAIPVLLAITLHEVAHGWTALQFGDRTAELLGRLTLNPLRHVDLMGTVIVPLVMILLTGWMFGWAKPVPVNPRNLRNPKRHMAYVAAAGPLSNLAMAFAWSFVLAFVTGLEIEGGAGEFFFEMARIGILFNVLLMVFNLVPIPPLDGGRVLRGLVSEPLARRLDGLEPYGLIIIVLLLATGVLIPLIGPVVMTIYRFILDLGGVSGA